MFRILSVALATVLACTSAQAGYYVEDDAPRPPAVVAKAVPSTKVVDATFSPKRSWMSPSMRKSLNEQLALFTGADEISIVASSAAPNNTKLAQQRIASIKEWLADNGVSRATITSEEDSEKRPRDLADAVSIYVTKRPSPPPAPPTRTVTRRAPASVEAAPQRVAQQPAQTGPSPLDDKGKVALLQRVISMGANKLIKPEDAFALLADILASKDASAAVPAPATPAVVATEPSRQWMLNGTLSLQQNLEEWARIAGYEPLVWRSGFLYTTNSQTISGTFTQAITELANVVPSLDFSLSKGRRTLTVTDAE